MNTGSAIKLAARITLNTPFFRQRKVQTMARGANPLPASEQKKEAGVEPFRDTLLAVTRAAGAMNRGKSRQGLYK